MDVPSTGDAYGDSDAHGIQTCPACGGYLQHMGVLGRRAHYQCRQCGTRTSQELDNESYRHTED